SHAPAPARRCCPNRIPASAGRAASRTRTRRPGTGLPGARARAGTGGGRTRPRPRGPSRAAAARPAPVRAAAPAPPRPTTARASATSPQKHVTLLPRLLYGPVGWSEGRCSAAVLDPFLEQRQPAIGRVLEVEDAVQPRAARRKRPAREVAEIAI